MKKIELSDDIIKKYEYLVTSNAKHIYIHSFGTYELEDLISYGYLGLVDAIINYNDCQNTDFSSYAKIKIKSSIYEGILQERGSVNYKEEIEHEEIDRFTQVTFPCSLDQKLKNNEIHDLGIEEDISNVVIKKLELKEIREVLNNRLKRLLTKEQLDIINQLYFEENTANLSQPEMIAEHNNALVKLGNDREFRRLRGYIS